MLSKMAICTNSTLQRLSRTLSKYRCPGSHGMTRKWADKRYIKALEQGKASIQRLEAEISGLETDKRVLQRQFDDLQRKINESAARDFNAEILQCALRDFRTTFAALNPPEQTEALQCVLKSVTIYPQKLDLEIFELEEFLPGSQNRKEWLGLSCL